MESRFFCEEHGEELEVENVTSRGGDVYIFVAPCKQCTAQQSVERTGATCEHGIPMSRACALCGDPQP